MSRFSCASSMMISPSTKLRDLPLKETNMLINILNRSNCWRELIGVVTHPDTGDLLFKTDDVGTLENQWKSGSSPAEVMWQRWSTSGSDQPDISDLINFLKKADLLRAVTDVRRDILKNNDEDDDIDDGKTLIHTPPKGNHFAELDIIAEVLADINIEHLTVFSYKDLQIATKDFSDESNIGQGAFGTVYKAVISENLVAVKRLKDPVDKQFVTELNILTRYKHENLLPLLGCSLNGPTHCLVYEYMINGSLQDRLACLDNSDPLPWETRLLIAYGSAQGINHLHTYGEKPMVHRDIKSANILLDENFVPKVGDFGLVRIGSNNTSTTTAVTENVYGTTVYMAREAFYGDVSVKLDTFSFGVVLLELLTGLPPYDAKREDKDLVTYIENCDNILKVLDPHTDWNPSSANALYQIAKNCLSESKRTRPTISQILDDLKNAVCHVDNN